MSTATATVETDESYTHPNGTRIHRHPNGTVTVGITDGTAHLTIAAGPGATPALLRLAFNAMRPELMPGARTEVGQ